MRKGNQRDSRWGGREEGKGGKSYPGEDSLPVWRHGEGCDRVVWAMPGHVEHTHQHNEQEREHRHSAHFNSTHVRAWSIFHKLESGFYNVRLLLVLRLVIREKCPAM